MSVDTNVEDATELNVDAAELAIFQAGINTYRRIKEYKSVADAVVPTRDQNPDKIAQLVEDGDITLTSKPIPGYRLTEQAYQLTPQGVERLTKLHLDGDLTGSLR